MCSVRAVLQNLGLNHKKAIITALYGGDIGLSYKVQLDKVSYFLKIPKRGGPDGLMEAEWSNLKLLSQIIPEKIPCLLSTKQDSTVGLLLEYIAPEQKSEAFWQNLGVTLANLHQKKSDKFGLERTNFIGTIPQPNTLSKSFASFFAESQLLYMYKLASSFFDRKFDKLIEKLCQKLPELIPKEKASLVHGDLWSGNILCGPDQNPFICDPASYFGHREADIAMSKLFGSFHSAFYLAYQETSPLQPNWQNRIDLFQLYPLLVHVNLFGAQYVPSCESIISKYS